jgi:hypothetical protein
MLSERGGLFHRLARLGRDRIAGLEDLDGVSGWRLLSDEDAA